ncbi:hypothetical protein PAECIP111892_04134 [Paenibacillus auburnensis]|jgi:hypothetical protein|uniref:Uncharacterized protein n=1 Tax=Paenibacillus auburnensis TaxID=2905649 RepID=A0ABM9CLN4_9BACL|nr:hypothetical protein [Paenibacillus auburnensis]CAH1215590.1 hypothetical protein PAECIP111892_04134 [Paenibacillus auburnensis]
MNYMEKHFSPENTNSNLHLIQSVQLSSLVHSVVSAAVYVSPER